MTVQLSNSDNHNDDKDRQAAYTLLRCVLGINIFIHGLSRLLAGSALFASKIVTQFAQTPLPHWSVYTFGLSLPWIEALLGFLLLIGLRTRAALIGGGLLILTLTFGSSLIQDWSAASSQLTYALAYAALLFLLRYNTWSIDQVLAKR